MKIYLGADHGGFAVKEKIKQWLIDKGEEVEDLGADKFEIGDSFVDYAAHVIEMIKGDNDRGILFCRNGVGMSIVANRFDKIRCVLGFDKEQVRRSRTDDEVNVLAIPADYLSEKEIQVIVEVFLETAVSGKEKYRQRLSAIPKCTC